jgi:hypothetical protein
MIKEIELACIDLMLRAHEGIKIWKVLKRISRIQISVCNSCTPSEGVILFLMRVKEVKRRQNECSC